MLDHPALSLIVLRAVPGADHVLTPEALAFVATLQARFGMRLNALMVARARRQERIDRGELPDYLPATKDTRQGIWEAAPVPEALRDRRVEIAGPPDRKTLVAALNAGARAVVADFEDATAPSFRNIVAGHANLLDHRDGTLEFEDPQTGKTLRAAPGLVIPRPRGLHMAEANVLIGGQPVSAALFDFGLSLFHSGRALAATGRGPFYDLPKLESHTEARFWNDVFLFAQDRVGLAPGTIKATVLVETLPAAFDMDEIVWELRDHIAGLASDPEDLIFSHIKTLRAHAAYALPDRDGLAADRAFLATFAARLVKVCHRRGIHALGAAQTATEALRLADLGHDGTRVSDPAQVAAIREVFDAEMPGPNQIRKQRQGWRIEPARLLHPHEGEVTEAGLRGNIALAMDYLAGWLSGRGTMALEGRTLDAATAELARAQLWHWLRHGALVDGAHRLTADRLGELIQAEIVAVLDRLGPGGFHRGHYAPAARILQEVATADAFPDFVTTAAAQVLNAFD